MKIGHYWCDQCDEPAFGDTCHLCHRPAAFKPADSNSSVPSQASVPPEFAAAAFAAMRRLVDAAPDVPSLAGAGEGQGEGQGEGRREVLQSAVHTPNSK